MARLANTSAVGWAVVLELDARAAAVLARGPTAMANLHAAACAHYRCRRA